jgi:hypothetical protein
LGIGPRGAPMTGFTIRGVDNKRLSLEGDEFALRGLPSGNYDLRFEAKGFPSVEQKQIFVPPGGARVLPALWMQPAGTLVVVVRDGQNKVFPEAQRKQLRVQLKDLKERTQAYHLRPVAVDETRGGYRFEGLAMSEFEVLVRGPRELLPVTQRAVFVQLDRPLTVRAVLRPKPPRKPRKNAAPKPPSGAPPAPGNGRPPRGSSDPGKHKD